MSMTFDEILEAEAFDRSLEMPWYPRQGYQDYDGMCMPEAISKDYPSQVDLCSSTFSVEVQAVPTTREVCTQTDPTEDVSLTHDVTKRQRTKTWPQEDPAVEVLGTAINMNELLIKLKWRCDHSHRSKKEKAEMHERIQFLERVFVK